MKMSKKKIIILSVLLIMILSFVGLLVVINQKISPKEVRKMVLTQLQVVFPRSEIALGEIDFSLGLAVKFKLKQLKIELNFFPLMKFKREFPFGQS